MVTAIKISPTKIEIVANRESKRESLGIKRTRKATKIQRARTSMLERKAPKNSLPKVRAKT